VTTHRFWIILSATLAVTTLMLAGSAVAQNSSYLRICSPDQYGQQTCDSTTDPNACIVNNSIVYDQYTCDQNAQRAVEDANRRAQEAATQNTAPATTPETPTTAETPTTPTTAETPTTPATATTPANSVTS
jgi:hypothetical protein